jgi:hypothetical protein
MSRVRWRVVPAGLLLVGLAVAGCGGIADRAATGGDGTARSHSSSDGSDLSAQEVDELEKLVSEAEGAAEQAERDTVDP